MEVADPADLAVLDHVRTPQPEPLGDPAEAAWSGWTCATSRRTPAALNSSLILRAASVASPRPWTDGEITQAISAESPTTVAWT